MSQQIINRGTVPDDGTGDSAYVFSGKVNANFTELYSSIQPPDVLINQTGTFSKSFGAKTWIEKFIIVPQLSTPSVKIGSEPGGNDILDTSEIGDYSLPVMIQLYYATGTIFYFTITGGNVNINFDSKVIFP